MCKKMIYLILLGIFVALLLITMPVNAVENSKISNYGGGHQIWFEVEDFDQRDPDDDSSFALGNEAGAFGQSISSVGSTDGASMIRYTFNIGSAGGAGGTWYFWGRVINPDNQSDFLLVEGHPGDTMPVTLPMGGLTDDQRVFEEDAGPPWTWSGNDHDEGHTKTLQDGENTMYILARQEGAIWDVFMWTDDAGYVPTDDDYQNALPGGGYGPALRPDPADGAIYTEIWASPRWRAGDFAVTHDVYFSDNFDDVNDGTGDAFIGNQPLGMEYFIVGFANAPYPDGLVQGTTYYWRIDEVNEADPNSPWKGDVWSFTVPSNKAYDPVPGDGAKYVAEDVELSWAAGLNAILHNVYFGDDLETVTNATGAPPQPNTTFSPGPLELEKTYYWRVDEFDTATTHTGDVWSFLTVPDIPITDANLLCWWKFDEDAGSTALDHSGHGHHGTLEGDTQWVDGIVGGALEFDGAGDRVVDNTAASYLNGLDAITVCMWIKSDIVGTDKGFINGEDPDDNDNVVTMRYDSAGGTGGGTNVLKMAVTSTEGEQQLESSNNAQTTDWQHVAMVWSSGQQLKFYINGVLDVPTDNQPATTGTITGCTKLVIGAGSKDAGGGWDGLIDDVRIYDRVLTAEEITEVMRGEPDLAWNPSPANRSTPDIKQATPLSWSPGDRAAQHDVYFGIDKDAVDNAEASDTTGIYRGRQSLASYTLPEGVEWGGGPYYWRVDEFNTDGTIGKGRIWSFTVSDFTLIDDFEIYDAGDNQIWFSWHDGLGYGVPGIGDYFAGNGTGGAVGDETTASYTEETIVRPGGLQSMPLAYDNNKQGYSKYSEAELTLSAVRDWTAEGVAELSIWFRGNAASVGSFVEGPIGTYTMIAAGTDIFNEADEFHYAYKTLTGAGSIIAKVISVEQADNWSKAGVMIRDTLGAGSKFAAVYITPTDAADGTSTYGCRFQARLDTDIDAVSDSSIATAEQTAIIAPYWVKIERDVAGNFRASFSADGSTWRQMSWNPQSISMNSNVYIGLAVTSHDAALTCEAVFSNVTTTGNVSGQWAHQDIGITSNAAEPLYVAVSNSAGSSAVVVHPDPAAANIVTWTEWIIPLQAFADQGINLTNVDRIAIGLGTRGNMTISGGSGKMYIDDIRLYRPSEAAE